MVQLNIDELAGSWSIVDGNLQLVTRGELMRLLTTGSEKWRDYDIEVDVKPIRETRIWKYWDRSTAS